MAETNNEALEILNRRLAGGEITPEQYDDLRARLSGDNPATPSPPKKQQAAPVGKKKFPTWAWILIGVLAITIIAQMGQSGGGKLYVTNANSGGFPYKLRGTVVNEGAAQNAWVYATVNGSAFCVEKIWLDASSQQDFSIPCNSLPDGNFTLMVSTQSPS